MRITTFASGSTGNCALISDGGTAILIDAGISMKRISGCLTAEGLTFDELSGVLITHEHSDHISGLPMLLKHHELRVYAPRMVAARLAATLPPGLEDYISAVDMRSPFDLGGVTVTAFRTMHDTPDSAGYRVDGDSGALGFCTDLGCVTDEVLEAIGGVDAAVIEANHDEQMLRYGSYPATLKRRILSDRGHLSNESSGELAVFLSRAGARDIMLAHLSRENNRPSKAFDAVTQALEAAGESARVSVAPQIGAATLEVRANCSV